MTDDFDALQRTITAFTQASVDTPDDLSALERLYPQIRAAIANADKVLRGMEKRAIETRKKLRADLRAIDAAYKRAKQKKTAP